MPIAAARNAPMPPVAVGFEHVERRWCSTDGLPTARVLPGEFYVSGNDESITTVLGSCVAACIYDPVAGVAGMNHFLLPDGASSDPLGASERYGIAAMESLINGLFKLGASKGRMVVKLFGGASVIETTSLRVGEMNAEFVREFVRNEKLTVAAEDLGAVYPRKVKFYVKGGKVLVKRLRSMQKRAIDDMEHRYLESIKPQQQTGDIELFS
jgi:chemotaxis protein CheD